ncbi:MAG: sensor histidine kinase [Eubacteriales bacterium]
MKIRLFFETYLIRILTFVSMLLFMSMVSYFDARTRMAPSNFLYLAITITILFFISILIDFTIKCKGLEKIKDNETLEAHLNLFHGFEKQYVQQLIHLQKSNMEMLDEMKNLKQQEMDFILSWAHDIKVPIAAIKLIIENNEQNSPPTIFHNLSQQINEIQYDIDKILYYVRVQDFTQDYIVDKVNIKNVVHKQLKHYWLFFSSKKIKLTMDNLDVTVLSDEKWLGFTINQLLSNSVKYVEQEGNIHIFIQQTPSDTILSIRNSGMGIKAEDLPRVFNRGFTGYIGRQGNKSTGYGLYLSKKLLNNLGHTLTVDSQYGKYAQFNVIFHNNATLYDITKT